MPSDGWLDYLRRDHKTMQVMMFGESPSFDEILDSIRALETEIRTCCVIHRGRAQASESAQVRQVPVKITS